MTPRELQVLRDLTYDGQPLSSETVHELLDEVESLTAETQELRRQLAVLRDTLASLHEALTVLVTIGDARLEEVLFQ